MQACTPDVWTLDAHEAARLHLHAVAITWDGRASVALVEAADEDGCAFSVAVDPRALPDIQGAIAAGDDAPLDADVWQTPDHPHVIRP